MTGTDDINDFLAYLQRKNLLNGLMDGYKLEKARELRIHKSTKQWDYTTEDFWLGTPFKVPNPSTGYHGILKQWWDHYKGNHSKWLLVSELNHIKEYFSRVYPGDQFNTLEFYASADQVDYRYNLCDRSIPDELPKFDIVVCQATLEHVYDPFSAVSNMVSVLNKNGLLTIHTHVQPYPYHPYPHDYVRFFSDWFIDIPKYIGSVELLDLCENDGHIFASYKKV
jgi:hypothetical protein